MTALSRLEMAVLAKLREKGVSLQDDPDDIRAALHGCTGRTRCIQAALDMRSRYQGEDRR